MFGGDTHTWLSLGVSWKASVETYCSPELEMVLGEGRAEHLHWGPQLPILGAPEIPRHQPPCFPVQGPHPVALTGS